MAEIPYIGNELEVFSHARNWKSYFGSRIKPYVKGRVLEVGAGLGGTTAVLCDGTQSEWICLEPDPALYEQLGKKLDDGELPACCSGIKGITTDLPTDRKFDAILYIDVIEHIEKDNDELRTASSLLADNGHLIVLVPAHQFVYSPFDKAIGHYRRYNKKMLRAAAPADLTLERLFYLDSTGLMASVVNKLFLKQSYPTLKQIVMWDRKLIPLSRIFDPLIGFQTGKALIAIWKKKL
jgi:SAM-dependent methyltransferase